MAQLPPHGERSGSGWRSELGRPPGGYDPPGRAPSLLSPTHPDMWDIKAQSSAWSIDGAHSGSGTFSTRSGSSPYRECVASPDISTGMKRWQSLSRLGPEGAVRTLCPSPRADLWSPLCKSGTWRETTGQRLCGTHGRLDSQTELLGPREVQLQHCQSSTQLLELRHKQLAEALSALEQEKDTAKPSHVEDSPRHKDLQEKVQQLELDMMKMRMTLEREKTVLLSRSVPTVQEDIYGKQQQAEKELKEARPALRKLQGKVAALEEERETALRQVRLSEESRLAALTEMEGLNRRLSNSEQAQIKLQDQLSEARGQLAQAGLERDLLSSKVVRLEDTVEDHKVKLSEALADKDRLLQEKAELHWRAQSLELQLDSAQKSREAFSGELGELHRDLADARAQAKRKEEEAAQMQEELRRNEQLKEGLMVELAEERRRLQVESARLRELEAERPLHTDRIAALEKEKSQLASQMGALQAAARQGGQEVTALRGRCEELRKSCNALHQENKELLSQCQSLDARILDKEAELRRKGEEHKRIDAEMAEELENLRRVGSQWKGRWSEVVKALQASQEALEGAKEQQHHCHHPADTLKKELAQLAAEVEKLQSEAESNQKEIQTLSWQKAEAEAELSMVKGEGGAPGRVELDACRRQLELERSRNRKLLQRLTGTSGPLEGRTGAFLLRYPIESDSDSTETGQGVRHLGGAGFVWPLIEPLFVIASPPATSEGRTYRYSSQNDAAVQMQEKGTETDSSSPPMEQAQWSTATRAPESPSNLQEPVQTLRETSLEEVDGELSQVQEEIQEVWNVPRLQVGDVEEQQGELLSPGGQVSQKSREVHRLEQQLTEQEHKLEEKEQALKNLERLRDTEQAESQSQITSLELKVAELKEQMQRAGSVGRTNCSKLESTGSVTESDTGTVHLPPEGDLAVQGLQQDRRRSGSPDIRREIRPKYIDHDNQMRLVTEQLKSLFREREQLGWVNDTSARKRRESRSLQDRATKSKLIKNVLETIQSQNTEEQELLREKGRLQRAVLSGAILDQQGEPEPQEQTAQHKMGSKQD
ncbi:myosin-7B-like [Brienomyrus brachyistius]|uniref:myosin-7B-like n=1 Tax=Brienomyrus brachyistius TaxID=42636 RepID=UPI0020B1E79F|nr:myosin-7B-like [Brienomyrus brachyistius]